MLVSIMGDSISTFTGANPAGYAVYFDRWGAAENGLRSVEDTWWMRVLRSIGGEVLVNDSFSGSLVTGDAFPAGSCPARTGNLAKGGLDPELILCYIGINDFGYCAPVEGFADAYARMLAAFGMNYPAARVVCSTIMRTHVEGYPNWTFPELNQAGEGLGAFDQAIRRAAADAGASVADLARCGTTYETLDGVHPTVEGHRQLAEAWIEGLAALGIGSGSLAR